MKLQTLLTILIFSITSNIFSQETTKPLTDSEIVRKVSKVDVEGVEYENVIITLKSLSPDYFSDIYRVKVTINDKDGNEVYKKTLKNVFLYVFSNGQIQVGKPNFHKIIIERNDSDSFNAKIREKEGIY